MLNPPALSYVVATPPFHVIQLAVEAYHRDGYVDLVRELVFFPRGWTDAAFWKCRTITQAERDSTLGPAAPATGR